MCEDDADMDVDYQRCGKRKHSFLTDPVDDPISYTFKSRSCTEKSWPLPTMPRP
jgi:hypothetical protein